MPGSISRVKLMGPSGAANGKTIAFTKRKLSQFSKNRFVGPYNENWLVVSGTGLRPVVDELVVKIGNDTYATHIIELAREPSPGNDGDIHIWFAVYKELRAGDLSDPELDSEVRSEDVEKLETLGIGTITVTIVTTDPPTAGGAPVTATNGDDIEGIVPNP